MSSNGPKQKRMRLGTHSCVECRRRKVKCVFEGPSRVCRECLAHDSPCEAQQLSNASRHSEIAQLFAPSSKENSESISHVNKRLNDLEGLVQRLCNAVERNHGARSLSPQDTQRTSITSSPTEDLSNSRAPLVDLLRDAMILLGDSEVNTDEVGTPTEYRNISSIISRLENYIPKSTTLVDILEATQKFWFIWPFSPVNSLAGKAAVVAAEEFIFKSMASRVPGVVAKAILWLSLCLQQLQGNYDHDKAHLPAPLQTILRIYTSEVETLLSHDTQGGGTIDGVEALMLQSKMCINMGRPQKAWLSVRQALNIALLRGLHREDSEKSSLWSSIWQMDRQTSSILGLAYAIPDSHPSLSAQLWSSQFSPSHTARNVAIIAGHITDRNEKRSGKSKLHPADELRLTAEIQSELEACWDRMPPTWHDPVPASNISLQDLYYRETTKINYFQCAKMLHLPYMLTGSSGASSSVYSGRNAAVSASRSLIHCYNNLRNRSGSVVIMCDLMDFLAFSAGLVLIIHIWSHPASSSHHQHGQESEVESIEKDCALVHELTKNLKMIARALLCSVADQGAQLLDHLTQVRNGTYQGPRPYETHIPYFGKIKINTPHSNNLKGAQKRTQTFLDPMSSGTTATPTSSSIDLTNVEFSGDSLMPYIDKSMAVNSLEAELGSDWTSLIDPQLDGQYDWSQVFNNLSWAPENNTGL